MPGKKGVYQKHQKYFQSLHGDRRQARKECIKSIKSIYDLFMAMDARQERVVYQKYQRISVLFVAKECQARKECISKVSKYF
jgi:hypothetical protein